MSGIMVLYQGLKRVVTGVGVQYDLTSQTTAAGQLRALASTLLFHKTEKNVLEESTFFSSSSQNGATLTPNANEASVALNVTSTIGSRR